MRSTWMPLGLALVLPATVFLGACGPGDTSSSGGSGGTTSSSTAGSGGETTTGGGGATGGTTTGGSTTGGGGTGGETMAMNDVCPGQEISLALDESKTFNGTLVGANDDYQTFCADTSPDTTAPDVVYQLDVPAAATVTLEINASGFVPALSLRKQECSQRLPGDACLDLGTGQVTTKVALDAGTYWVVVDSADKNVGTFTFKVTYATPACGDGVVNPGEQCDPATPSDDDGCFNPGKPNACHFGEPPPDPAIVMCPGGIIPIAKGDKIPLGPYNNGSGGHNQVNATDQNCDPTTDPTCCNYGGTGPEDVFHITPSGDGTLTAQIGYAEDGVTLYCDANPADCGDFIMYLRKNMCDSAAAADQLKCTDYTPNPNSPFGFDEVLTVTTPVTAGSDYWLVVDGLDDMYGIGGYYLTLTLQ